MKNFFRFLKRITAKHKRILLFLFLFWGIWAFGLGFLGGWLLTKGTMNKFPEISNETRLLVIVPHIDDEAIAVAGVVQRVRASGGLVKIVYLTNGDDNLASVLDKNKIAKLTPDEFITLGEERMREGKRAMKILGLEEQDLIFLGFPDSGLRPMLGKNYSKDNLYTSKATKFNYNPYRQTYKNGQSYTGENLEADLKEIIDNFKPNLIIVSHPKDHHPDHQAAYHFLERLLTEEEIQVRVFTYLVHFSFYPPEKKLKMSTFLYPPKKLFSQEGWFSFDLSQEEEEKKLQAIDEYHSQLEFTKVYDFLRSFVKRNEIFEEDLRHLLP